MGNRSRRHSGRNDRRESRRLEPADQLDAMWPFGDQPSPYTFEGQLRSARGTTRAAVHALSQSRGRRFLLLAALVPLAVVLVGALLAG